MTNIQSLSHRKSHSQHGTALVISLIMLTLVTLLSVSAMRSANLDTKIAVNQQLREMTFQASENALSMVTGPTVTIDLPTELGEDNAVTTTNYFQSTGVDNQSNFSADVTVEMLEISRKYHFSGFPLNILTILYQADAQGAVAGTHTKTVNRKKVALIRN